MTLNQNQFNMIPVQGQNAKNGGLVLPCMVASGQATALIPGQPVKISNTTGGIPNVVSLAANTDATFGFVLFNQKDINYPAYSRLEVAMAYSTVFMTAGAAIARGVLVEVVYTTNKVITYAGINPAVGFTLDAAAADGDLIPVMVLTPAFALTAIANITGLQAALDVLTAAAAAAQAVADAAVKEIKVTATLAQINAGYEIIPATTGKKIRVLTYIARVNGASFAANTSVDLQSGTTHTKVTALGVAGLTSGAILVPASGNTTLGAGFGADLEISENLTAVNVGTTATTATGITFTVSYALV